MDYFRLPHTFDVQRLRTDLHEIRKDEWIPHFNTRDYNGSWSIAPLRSPAGMANSPYATPNVEIYRNTPILERCPYFQEVISWFECPMTAVRLMRLDPGSEITEHSDSHLSFEEGEARIHVPIAVNPDVRFYLNRERVTMKEGEVWYLDFTKPHAVTNEGSEPRVHLVLDCVVNDWLRSIFGEKSIVDAV